MSDWDIKRSLNPALAKAKILERSVPLRSPDVTLLEFRKRLIEVLESKNIGYRSISISYPKPYYDSTIGLVLHRFKTEIELMMPAKKVMLDRLLNRQEDYKYWDIFNQVYRYRRDGELKFLP